MMESRKSEKGVSRPKQKPARQIGMKQFLFVGIGIVVAIVLALLLFGGGGRKKPATARRARTDSLSESGSARRSRRASARRTARASVSRREDDRARRREERLQRRKDDTRASARRTSRSSSGSSTSGGTRVTSSPNELRAIIDDGTGSRTALVGERRLRAGDDIEGRRIVEVSGEGVKVEYRQSTYMVKVGQKVY